MNQDMQFKMLEQFVTAIKNNPDMLHLPQLAFFKQYLESLGATIPACKPREEPKSKEPEAKKPEEKKETAPEPMVEEEVEEVIADPEYDMSGVIQPEADEPLSMGDAAKQPSEEETDKANELRSAAMQALGNGDTKEAVEAFTMAIDLNAHSAVFFAKRAQALLKLNRPVAAIRDCDRAIELNPDSAAAFKNRGRGKQLLGRFEEAYVDFGSAEKIDFDESTHMWMKEVESNAKLQREHRVRLERRDREAEVKRRRAEIKKRQEQHEQARREAAATVDDDDDMMGGMPGGMGDMGGLFNDPELLNLIKDPKVMEAMQDPTKMAALAADPKYAKLMMLMQSLGGQMGGGGGMPGGMPGGMGGGMPSFSTDSPPTSTPQMAPEPDID